MFYSLVMVTDAETETRHPTVIYIESVCKKASDEGFTLHIGEGGFVWKDTKGDTFGAEWNLDPKTLMLEACIALETRQKWNLLADSA